MQEPFWDRKLYSCKNHGPLNLFANFEAQSS